MVILGGWIVSYERGTPVLGATAKAPGPTRQMAPDAVSASIAACITNLPLTTFVVSMTFAPKMAQAKASIWP